MTTQTNNQNEILAPQRPNGHAPAEAKPQAKPPALPELTTLSDDVLARLAEEVPKERERRRTERQEKLFAYFREEAAALGVEPTRLAAALSGKSAGRTRVANGGTDGRSNVKPKYRHPKTGHTWSGRGGAPKWYADFLASGGSEVDLRVPPETT